MVARRLGLESAANRQVLIDAAEALLREEGFTAITARQVAAKAGVKVPLVYYYFKTMDDLILAVVRQINERRITRFEEALQSSEPLKAVWKLNSDSTNATVTSELIWLATHRPAIRTEIMRAARSFRSRQIKEVARILEENGVDREAYPAAAVVAMMSSLGRAIVTDTPLGLTAGYPEAVRVLERTLARLSRKSRSGKRDKRNERS
jgi:TetR/AcrR family transcriptional regulator